MIKLTKADTLQPACVRYGVKAFASVDMTEATSETLSAMAEHFDVLTVDAACAEFEAMGMKIKADPEGFTRVA